MVKIRQNSDLTHSFKYFSLTASLKNQAKVYFKIIKQNLKTGKVVIITVL